MHNESSSRSNIYFLGISVLSLFTFILQFVFRTLDDNRLTSWEYAFVGTDASVVLLILVAGLIFALFFVRISIPERYYPMVLFVASFCSAAIFWGEPEVNVDSSRYFTQAKHLEVYGISYFVKEWGRAINAWTDMPLIPFLYGIVFRVFGESRVYIQILTTTLFSLSAVLTYWLGKSLWDRETGFMAGVLLLGMPYVLTQVPLMLVDVPTMFFLLLAVVTLINALEKGTAPSVVIAGISAALAFYTKYSVWLMMSVLAVVFIYYVIRESGHGSEEPGSRRTGVSACFSRFLAVTGIAALIIGLVFLYKFDLFMDQIRLLLHYQKPGLSRWHETFLSTFFFQIHPFITLAAVYSVYAAIRKKDLRYLIVAWLIMLVFALQIRRIRYIIMVFPMIALMAAYAITQIRNIAVKRFLVFAVLISSLTVAVFGYLPFLQRISMVNLKDAGKFVDSLNEPHIEVFTLMPQNPVLNPAVSVPILDLFTRKKIIYDYDRRLFDQPKEKIEKSPLRFTWEYENPEYYTGKSSDNAERAVLVISEKPDDALPPDLASRIKGYILTTTFKTSEEIFRYQTCVRIYREKGADSGL
jgi:hypothetical protein